MGRLINICSLFLLLFITVTNCNVPNPLEATDLAQQASLGIPIEVIDQNLNVLVKNFNKTCKLKLSKKESAVIRTKLNTLIEHVYQVNEAYLKFKVIFSLENKTESKAQDIIQLIESENHPTDQVQKIFEQLNDPSDPVFYFAFSYSKGTDTAAYLFGLLYEIVIYAEIKALAIQLYSNSISNESDKNCHAEIAKDRTQFRLSTTLNYMNKALEGLKE